MAKTPKKPQCVVSRYSGKVVPRAFEHWVGSKRHRDYSAEHCRVMTKSSEWLEGQRVTAVHSRTNPLWNMDVGEVVLLTSDVLSPRDLQMRLGKWRKSLRDNHKKDLFNRRVYRSLQMRNGLLVARVT